MKELHGSMVAFGVASKCRGMLKSSSALHRDKVLIASVLHRILTMLSINHMKCES